MKENEALKEVGKAVLAFANILTALFLVNILIVQNGGIFQAVAPLVGYLSIYYFGYSIIKKGELHGN